MDSQLTTAGRKASPKAATRREQALAAFAHVPFKANGPQKRPNDIKEMRRRQGLMKRTCSTTELLLRSEQAGLEPATW